MHNVILFERREIRITLTCVQGDCDQSRVYLVFLWGFAVGQVLARGTFNLISSGTQPLCDFGQRVEYYSSSTERWSLNKCASEEWNIEEVRHKIKVSNHSATRLVRCWQKPSQGHCLQSVAIETTHSCQTGTFKPAVWVITLLYHSRLSPRKHP